MKTRNHAFDILCGICIIRMVTLHIMAFCGQDKQDWWLEIMRWSFFFMSFFFFKAGYFNKGTSAGTDLEYLRDPRNVCSCHTSRQASSAQSFTSASTSLWSTDTISLSNPLNGTTFG